MISIARGTLILFSPLGYRGKPRSQGEHIDAPDLPTFGALLFNLIQTPRENN
jgi:hypothetical protein